MPLPTITSLSFFIMGEGLSGNQLIRNNNANAETRPLQGRIVRTG